MADLNKEKQSLHLIQCKHRMQFISRLSANMEASFLYTVVAVSPIPPQAEKKNRIEKQTLLTSHHKHVCKTPTLKVRGTWFDSHCIQRFSFF